jgi:hypothetical protein
VVLGKMWKSVFDIPVMMDDLNIVLELNYKRFCRIGTYVSRFIHSIHICSEEVQGMIDIRSGGMQWEILTNI